MVKPSGRRGDASYGTAVVLVALRPLVSNLNESLDSAVLKDMQERVRAVDERIKEVVFRLG